MFVFLEMSQRQLVALSERDRAAVAVRLPRRVRLMAEEHVE